jgi:hypothetical protein
MRFNSQNPTRQTATTPTENFDSLIEHAACLLAVSSSAEIDEVGAKKLY